MNLTTGHKGLLVGVIAGILIAWVWRRRTQGG